MKKAAIKKQTRSANRDITDLSLNKNLYVASLNFLNCFDKIDQDFVFFALQKFGQGDKFIQVFKVTFPNIRSNIKLNGLPPDPFTLIGGVH